MHRGNGEEESQRNKGVEGGSGTSTEEGTVNE